MNAEQLERAGRGLFGERWQSPLARAVGVSIPQMQRYAKGSYEIPRAVELAVKYLSAHPKIAQEYGQKR